MDHWPGSEKSSQIGKKKGKIVQSSSASRQISYPSLNHGSLTAGTTLKQNETFQWSTAAGKCKGSFSVKTRPTCVFPATRSPDGKDTSHSLKQRAEQGARFIRTHHPDIDIPFEIIKEELYIDERGSATVGVFDPFLGDTLSTLHSTEASKKQSILVLFPMGEVNSELNASLITSRKDYLYFQPTPKSVWISDSPIRQIVSSSLATSLDNRGGRYAAIRSYGATTILDFSFAFSFTSRKVSEIVKIQAEDLGGEKAMDMTFCSSRHPNLCAIGDRGTIFKIVLNDGRKTMDKIPQISEEESVWKISACHDYTTGYVSSESFIKRFDWRDGLGDTLFRIDKRPPFITSVTPSISNKHVLWVTTTDEVLWIDTRRTQLPLLAWKHHREFDRTLQVKTVDCKNSSLGFLSSRHNRLTTAFSVTAGHTDLQPLSFEGHPTALPFLPINSAGHECALLKHPKDCDFSLFELTGTGSLYHQELHYHDGSRETDHEDCTSASIKTTWSSEMKSRSNTSQNLHADLGKFASKDYMEVDLSHLYKKLFEDAVEQRREDDEKATDSVYNALERMPSFWQFTDTDTEHMRTMFDIAFGSGEEPVSEARADFLTGSVLNSVRGWRALRQKTIPFDLITSKSAWSKDLKKILENIDSESFKEDEEGQIQYKQTYKLQRDQDNPEARQRETEDREQLDLDLALASSVCSAVPFKNAKPDEDEDEEAGALLSRATQKMSLSTNEPSAITFGYLQPVYKDYYRAGISKKETVIADEEDIELKLPLGVRLLLSEWDIGVDPKTYTFTDPYNLDENSSPVPTQTRSNRRNDRGKGNSSPEPEDVLPTVFSQAPPTIVAAKTLASSQPKPSGTEFLQTLNSRVYSSTQLNFSQAAVTRGLSEEPDSSQPAMPSTQILPGPFGGRPNLAKKKPAKKRVGGF